MRRDQYAERSDDDCGGFFQHRVEDWWEPWIKQADRILEDEDVVEPVYRVGIDAPDRKEAISGKDTVETIADVREQHLSAIVMLFLTQDTRALR